MVSLLTVDGPTRSVVWPGAVTLPANHLDMSHEWGPEGVNGFMIGDFYRDRVECSFYGWDGRTQSVDSIADLDASYVTTIEPVA